MEISVEREGTNLSLLKLLCSSLASKHDISKPQGKEIIERAWLTSDGKRLGRRHFSFFGEQYQTCGQQDRQGLL